MDHPDTTTDPNLNEDNPSITHIFDVDEEPPSEIQRTVHHYLSQETRHNIIQVLLGHPSHLASTTEFAYYIPRSRSAISDQLADLADHKLITQYQHEPNTDSRGVPADFWGFTEFGVNLLSEYNYLSGLPIMRTVHDATHKTETVQRHEDAARPSLPEYVYQALDYDEPDTPTDAVDEDTTLSELREQTFYVDAAPENPHVLNENTGGSRTLDELF